MNLKICQRSIIAITVVGISMVSRQASADVPPFPYITDLGQEGQDVKIEVVYFWLDGAFNLTRTQTGEDSVAILSPEEVQKPVDADYSCQSSLWGTSFKEDSCELHPGECLSCSDSGDDICLGKDCDSCRPVEDGIIYGDNDFCLAYPEYGKDCDGDGSVDCCLCLDVISFYDFWDYCVPPGHTEYRVSNGNGNSSGSIDVIDSGNGCGDWAGHSDSDSTEDVPMDSDSDLPSNDTDVPSTDTGERREDAGIEAPATASSDSGCHIVKTGASSSAPSILDLVFRVL